MLRPGTSNISRATKRQQMPNLPLSLQCRPASCHNCAAKDPLRLSFLMSLRHKYERILEKTWAHICKHITRGLLNGLLSFDRLYQTLQRAKQKYPPSFTSKSSKPSRHWYHEFKWILLRDASYITLYTISSRIIITNDEWTIVNLPWWPPNW